MVPPIAGMRERAAAESARFLASETFAWLTSSSIAQTLVEVPFAHICNDQQWMEGIVDLIVITQGGDVVVLDWKTNRPSGSESDADFALHLADVYRLQLAAYADAIESATGQKVTRQLLFSTTLGEQVVVV